MRRRDLSIKRRQSVRPARDEDFTIADKYPEKEKEPALLVKKQAEPALLVRKRAAPALEIIDAPALLVKKQEAVALLGFANPLPSRKRKEIRRIEAGPPGRISPLKDTTARDITAISQVSTPIFRPLPRRERGPFIHTFFGDKKIPRPISEVAAIPERVKISVPLGEFGSGIIEAEKAARTGWLDRFFIWINRLLERKK